MLYKWLNNQRSPNFPACLWSENRVTKIVEGELRFCENGYHLSLSDNLISSISQDLYQVKPIGHALYQEGVVVARQCRLISRVDRWNKESARLLTYECVKHIGALKDKQQAKIEEFLDHCWWFGARVTTADAAWGAACKVSVTGDDKWHQAFQEERKWQNKKLLEILNV